MNHLRSMMMSVLLVSCLATYSFAGWFSKKSECKKCEMAQKESCEQKKDCGQAMKACKMKGDGAVLSTAALKILLDSQTDLILLDARSGKYDDGKRIPGAKSLNEGSSAKEIEKVIPSKESLVVTYCGGLQCPASSKLHKHLTKLGYVNVLEYPEGIKGWVEAKNAVEVKNEK